jgi:RHS repeat-associated protein
MKNPQNTPSGRWVGIRNISDYSSFGVLLKERTVESADFRRGFQGQEHDDEVKGEGNSVNFKYRMHDPRVGRFFAVDPLIKSYPGHSSYSFSLNCVINGVELEGLEYYYSADGRFLGKVGDSPYVRVVKAEHIEEAEGALLLIHMMSSSDSKLAKSTIKYLQKEYLNPHDIKTEKTITEILSFAAVVDNESGGNKEESYAIANVTMNYIAEGGSTTLKSLDDVTMYKNSFARGATQANYTNFRAKNVTEQNSKYAVGAVLNAILYNKDIQGFTDYSGGADSWDGIDLISTKWSNPHRDYIWSEASRELLSTYKANNNGGVKVENFNYHSTNFEIEAVKIIGKTLYTNVQTNRTERKSSQARFQ